MEYFRWKKHAYRIAYFIVAFIFLFTCVSFAGDTTSVRFHASPHKLDGGNIVALEEPSWGNGRLFALWRLGNYEANSADELISIQESVYKMTDAELDKSYQLIANPAAKAGADGTFNLDLRDGVYYIKEIPDANSESYLSGLVFQISREDNIGAQDVYMKSVIKQEKPKAGGLKLNKVDEEDKPLKGVGFRLYLLVDGVHKPLPLSMVGNTIMYSPDGQADVTLYTDDNGEINIGNLPIGDYIIEETKPLENYVIKVKNHRFNTIENNTTKVKVVNEKKPPSKPPFTGDQIALLIGYIAIFVAGAFFLILLLMKKRDRDKDKANYDK